MNEFTFILKFQQIKDKTKTECRLHRLYTTRVFCSNDVSVGNVNNSHSVEESETNGFFLIKRKKKILFVSHASHVCTFDLTCCLLIFEKK